MEAWSPCLYFRLLRKCNPFIEVTLASRAFRQGHHINAHGVCRKPVLGERPLWGRSLLEQNPFLWSSLIPLSFSRPPCHIFYDSSQGTKASRIFCTLGISIPISNSDSKEGELVECSQGDPSIVHLMSTAFSVMKNGTEGCMITQSSDQTQEFYQDLHLQSPFTSITLFCSHTHPLKEGRMDVFVSILQKRK